MKKLSEMNTLELSQALCKLAGPLERIGSDEAISEFFRTMNEQSGKVSRLQASAVMVGKLVPVLLDRHQQDTFAVLSVLTGKSETEIQTQNGGQTIREIKEALSKDLMDFFSQSA